MQHIRYLQTRSLSNMPDKEAELRMYYTYKFLTSMLESEIDFDFLLLFIELGKRLGKKSRMKEGLSTYMQKLIDCKKLHPIPADTEGNWMFNNPSCLTCFFSEDEAVADRFCEYRARDNFSTDLMRAIHVGGKKLLLRLFEHVFFSDLEPITFKKIPVLKKVNDAIMKIDIADFLVATKMISRTQALFLQIQYRISTTKIFDDRLGVLSLTPMDAARKLGMTQRQLEEINESQTEGLINGFLDYDFDLEKIAYSCFSARSLKPYFNNMSRKLSVKNAFPLKSFPITKELSDIALSLLSGKDSVNLLLYGSTGSGKTEYAKSLVKACGLNAVRFRNSFESETSVDAAICSLNTLLSLQKYLICAGNTK